MWNRFQSICSLTLAATFLLAGCEETGKRQTARVRPPEVQLSAPVSLASLPLSQRAQTNSSLVAIQQPAIERTIAAIEDAYQSGKKSFDAGDYAKARAEFQRAVDTLLSNGLNVDLDPRLEPLMDRVVNALHDNEQAAAGETPDAAQPKAEPAPIDEIAEMNYPVDPSLKSTVELSLRNLPHDLPITVTDEVLSYLNFFQTNRGRAIVANGLRRAGRYREMISRVLREEGVPQDMIYLAQAESGFQPTALSRARALGMWQFLAWRGREYDLKRSWWVDERRDPEKSTRAAARHLRDLYAMFGDWYLAIAAYNTGPGNVQKAVERTGYADFWELYHRNALLKETKNYVPIILALALIAKDAPRYGIEVDPEEPPQTERVKPGHPIDLRLVADTIDVSVDELKMLNPQLLRLATPPDPDFEIQLPLGTAERFTTEIASIPSEKWLTWRRHRVAEGETLATIAKKYRLQPSAIAKVNELEAGVPLVAGQKLLIPASYPAKERDTAGRLVQYRVRRGDTLETIAEQFSVTPEQIRSWNRLRGEKVSRGMTLRIYPGGKPASSRRTQSAGAAPEPEKAAKNSAGSRLRVASNSQKSSGEQITHRVKRGETLWSIAKAYQTTVEALREANRFLFTRQLQVGDQLIILSSH